MTLDAFIPPELDDLGLDVYEFRVFVRVMYQSLPGESSYEIAAATGLSRRKARSALASLLARQLLVLDIAEGGTRVEYGPGPAWLKAWSGGGR